MGEQWGVFYADLGENWLHYNGTTQYVQIALSYTSFTDIPQGYSLGLKHSYDWPSASEVSLKIMGKWLTCMKSYYIP